MARIVRDWRIDLIQAYPDLFHPFPDNPEVAQASPECGAGWQDLLERACARALSLEADARVEEIIDLAEARSACTCEVCGAEGRLHRAGGWLMTRCAAHGQGHPVPEKPGWENVTISHVVASGTKTVIVKRRRYVRETDSFVEVDSLIIGEGG